MKKIWLVLILGNITLVSFAQKTNAAKPIPAATQVADPDCADFIKICDLVSSGKLSTIKADHFHSRYYTTDDDYTVTLKIPGTLENFINDDRDFGASFHCFYKDYGLNGTAAKNDFVVISKKISDCLGKKLIPETDGTEYDSHILYKNCKVEIQAFYSTKTNSWVTGIIITN